METKLHLLESFDARSTDGTNVRIYAYEHLLRDDSLPGALDAWEPTGTVEYRLADGRRVVVGPDGTVQGADAGSDARHAEPH